MKNMAAEVRIQGGIGTIVPVMRILQDVVVIVASFSMCRFISGMVAQN